MRLIGTLVACVLMGCGGSVSPRPAVPPPLPQVNVSVTETPPTSGSGALLSGTLAYGATNGASFEIEVLKIDPEGGPRRVRLVSLPGPGPWEAEVPKNIGPVRVRAAVDVPQIGPAIGLYWVVANGLVIGDASVSGIDLVAVQGGSEATITTLPGPPSMPPLGAANAVATATATAPPTP